MIEKRDSFDLIVVGGGPGGYPLAARMAQNGWKTALVENPGELGGTCLNWGCIPTKALLASAKGMSFLRNAKDWGLTLSEPGFDWKLVQERKGRVVNAMRQGVEQFLTKAKVARFEGEARLLSDSRLDVHHPDGKVSHLLAGKICLAVGSKPSRPSWIPDNRNLFWTSDEALVTDVIPQKLLVIGGGVIGLEMGQIFSEFGSQVHIVELLPQILTGLDTAVSRRLLQVFRSKGLNIQTGIKVEALTEKNGQVEAVIKGKTEIFDRVLLAIGRRLNRSVFLDSPLDPEMSDGVLKVNDSFETSIPGVFAIGDAVPGPMLAHKAGYDAQVLGDQWLDKACRPAYDIVPSCVYTHPEIAWVGLSEDQARQKGIPVTLGRSLFSANGKALAGGYPDGQVKTLQDPEGNLLGAVIWGPEACHLIMEPTMMLAHRISCKELLSVIHPHPTLSETFYEAVANGCDRKIGTVAT